MKKASSGQNLDVNFTLLSCFIHSSSAEVNIHTRAQEYRPKRRKFGNFSLVSLSRHTPFRLRAERIRQGEGRWSRLLKAVLERSDLTEKFKVQDSRTEAETNKSPSPIPTLSKKYIFSYMYICIFSVRTSVFTHRQ